MKVDRSHKKLRKKKFENEHISKKLTDRWLIIFFCLILIVLLVFLELSEPVEKKGFTIKGLRVRFSRLLIILFVVFLAMVFTKVVMIIG